MGDVLCGAYNFSSVSKSSLKRLFLKSVSAKKLGERIECNDISDT